MSPTIQLMTCSYLREGIKNTRRWNNYPILEKENQVVKINWIRLTGVQTKFRSSLSFTFHKIIIPRCIASISMSIHITPHISIHQLDLRLSLSLNYVISRQFHSLHFAHLSRISFYWTVSLPIPLNLSRTVLCPSSFPPLSPKHWNVHSTGQPSLLCWSREAKISPDHRINRVPSINGQWNI